DLVFQTEKNGFATVPGVSEVVSSFNPATGNYETIMKDAQGKTIATAVTLKDGTIKSFDFATTEKIPPLPESKPADGVVKTPDGSSIETKDGRPIKITYKDGGSREFHYDATGQLSSIEVHNNKHSYTLTRLRNADGSFKDEWNDSSTNDVHKMKISV